MSEDPGAQKIAALNIAILRSRGIELSPDAMILDYGCGSGRFAYQHLDLGFQNTFGYDVANYLALRQPEDIAHFRFDPRPGPADSFPPMTEVPWPDDTFDFVFATSVFEHVRDQELGYREIRRVLKPGGAFLNVFPSKWRLIEPHMFVPFGGVIRLKSWYRLWAALGIRNGFQQGFSAARTAAENHRFSREGFNYPGGAEIARMMDAIFGEWEYVEDAFVQNSPGRSRHIAGAMRAFPPLRNLFRFAHMRVILARKAKVDR
jgi:SAM-dependent methyltransferase